MNQDRTISSSLVKALDLITFMTGHPEGMRLVDLVEGSGLPRSTTIRILQTLQDYGLITKDGKTYSLSEQFRGWSSPDRYSRLRNRYRPILEAVSSEVQELVLAGLREGGAIIHIDYVEWDHTIRVAPTPHTRHPLQQHALGKLAMSWQPGILEATSDRALRAELEEVQNTGVAWNREESEQGMIAMATWGLKQNPIEPMIAVAWPSFRFSEASAQRALSVIRKTVAAQLMTTASKP